jgi:hypothetical protein
MNLQIEGKIIQILEPKSGESRNGKWLKQEFVIETQETYPRKVCLQVWNDKADLLKQFSTGETIVASINIESREYNERWYTDIKAWKLEKPTVRPLRLRKQLRCLKMTCCRLKPMSLPEMMHLWQRKTTDCRFKPFFLTNLFRGQAHKIFFCNFFRVHGGLKC